MKFVLNRNKTHSSTMGHTIRFEKNIPVHVPPDMYQEVMAFGAQPEEELPVTETAETREPADPQARKALIFKAMEQMVLEQRRGDFTGSGLPHVAALKDRLGFVIEPQERAKLWGEFNDSKVEA